MVPLSGKLTNVGFDVDFLMCHIADDAILKIEFTSKKQDCALAYGKRLLAIIDKANRYKD